MPERSGASASARDSLEPLRGACAEQQRRGGGRGPAAPAESGGYASKECRAALQACLHVRTVNNKYPATAPKRMFGAHAASSGEIHPPLPSAPNMLSAVQ